jgi:hypothetical protein
MVPPRVMRLAWMQSLLLPLGRMTDAEAPAASTRARMDNATLVMDLVGLEREVQKQTWVFIAVASSLLLL